MANIQGISPFAQMVEKTFPNPEILRVDFSPLTAAGPNKISVKVKVTGDFLDDEWFWEDYLKYFKLRTFIAFDPQKYGIYDNPMFEEEDTPVLGFGEQERINQGPRAYMKDPTSQNTTPPKRDYSVSLTALENRSNKLANEYIYESSLVLPESFDLASVDFAVIARTFFDTEAFRKDFLGENDVVNFLPLQPGNNGRWDVIEFDFENRSIVKCQRRYAYWRDETDPWGLDSDGRRWNSAFSTNGKEFFATADIWSPTTGFASPGTFAREILFNTEPFWGSNVWMTLVNSMVTNYLGNPYKGQPSQGRIGTPTAFSDIYLSKAEKGNINLYFSFDFISLLERTTTVPDVVFDNLRQQLGNITRNICIEDISAKELTTGTYSYAVQLAVTNTMEDILNINVEETINSSNQEKIKSMYEKNTEEAYKKGVFGSPTFIYNGEVFWGDDRLEDCIKWIKMN